MAGPAKKNEIKKKMDIVNLADSCEGRDILVVERSGRDTDGTTSVT